MDSLNEKGGVSFQVTKTVKPVFANRRKETPPMLRIQDPPKETKQEEVGVTLDGLAREGARRMLMTALEEEVSDYIERNA